MGIIDINWAEQLTDFVRLLIIIFSVRKNVLYFLNDPYTVTTLVLN